MSISEKKHKPSRRWLLIFSALFAIVIAPVGSWMMFQVQILNQIQLVIAMAIWALGTAAVWSNFKAFSGRYANGTVPRSNPTTLKVFLIITFLLSIIWAVFLIKHSLNENATFLSIQNAVVFIVTLVSFFYFTHISAALLFQFRIVDYTHQKAGVLDYLTVIILPLLISAATARAAYYHEAETVTKGPADYSLKMPDMISEFEKSDSLASLKYVGKSIRFSGLVTEILLDTNVVIKLDARKSEYSVNCNFDKAVKDKVSGILAGDSLELQCSCSGINKPDEELSMLSESSLIMTRCNLLHWHKSKVDVGTDIEKPNTKDTNH